MNTTIESPKPLRQEKYQQRNLAAGLCRLCPERRVTAMHCAKHAKLHSEKEALRARNKRLLNGAL